MKVGDIVTFSRDHRAFPGTAYTEGWCGIVTDIIFDSSGAPEEIYILWSHGKVSDYPSAWWNKLSYFPFEVISACNMSTAMV